MSRTDKTRPHWVKVKQYPEDANIYWRREFGCGLGCPTCGIHRVERRRPRREGKRQARDWRREYE